MLMLMGLKDLPSRRLYWNDRPSYGCPVIKSLSMTRQRFEDILRCIHLVNNDHLASNPKDPRHDKIGKVRWLVERFARIAHEEYNAERVCTVDEMIVAYKGRFCPILQYMKAKPVKFGIKVWVLASSQSRYVSNIILYIGASTEREEGDSVGEEAVLTAVRGLENRGHVIVTDNFFTSPRLLMALMARGFWSTGTCRKTRKGFPPSLAGFPKTFLPEGGTLIVKMHRSRKVAAICWIDSKPVWFLSSASNPMAENCFVARWVKRDRVDFPTSPTLLEYQSNMRGIDVVDQQRGEYSVQLDTHKWWHNILFFVVDSSLLDSNILYHEDHVRMGQ